MEKRSLPEVTFLSGLGWLLGGKKSLPEVTFCLVWDGFRVEKNHWVAFGWEKVTSRSDLLSGLGWLSGGKKVTSRSGFFVWFGVAFG